MLTFKLGNVTVPLVAASEFTQGFSRVGGGRTDRRTLNGTDKICVHFKKIATDISFSGRVASGLSALNTDVQTLMSSGAPIAIESSSNIIVIPTERRADADHTPFGFALFSDRVQATPLSISGDTATLTLVTGATLYSVSYFPEFMVTIKGINESVNRSGGIFSTQITAEEA